MHFAYKAALDAYNGAFRSALLGRLPFARTARERTSASPHLKILSAGAIFLCAMPCGAYSLCHCVFAFVVLNKVNVTTLLPRLQAKP
jgi:hypothetical protein